MLRARRKLFFFILATIFRQSQSLEFSVKRRALHANERGSAGDVSRKTSDLRLQIFPFESLAGLAQRCCDERTHRLLRRQALLVVKDRQSVGEGKGVAVRVAMGGRRILKKQTRINKRWKSSE